MERWNGTSWAADGSLSSSAGLYAISCPSLNDCIAVGKGPSAEHWDGITWTAQSFPQTGAAAAAQSFDAVSCGSATACVAVNDNNGLTAAWNGSSWKINQQFANEEIDFYAVSCMTASSCVAVSEASPPPAASYGWDGSTWSLQAKFSAPARPMSVSCVAPLTCVAVGSYGRSGGPFAMLAERYQ